MRKNGRILIALALMAPAAHAEVPVYEARLLAEFVTFDARQGVAVDGEYFYAVNNTRITKHDKRTGEPLLQWDGGPEAEGALVHLDSAVEREGKLYAAHSNYPAWPMSSSVEVWDTATMEHVATHSFGMGPGSFTWLDYHAGYWWGTFANYDKVQDGQSAAYGTTPATTLVKMDDTFSLLERWLFPAALHERFTPMSNSGGSWGRDGRLYITGHDRPEIYVVGIPAQGSELEWLATVEAPSIEGQGIAWDRSGDAPELWGILKADRKVFRFAMPEIGMEVDASRRTGVIREAPAFKRD